MRKSPEFESFDSAMRNILRADPKAVKAAVDAEIKTNTTDRKVKGERKRGRKPKSTLASAPVFRKQD